MLLIEINEVPLLVKKDLSILEAVKMSGVIIPRFCYHELLSISGNCRMCLVEVFNTRLPIASCSVLITANIKIFTNTPVVKKARENIMETLLLNHPMDCPICDQGGECDLQDQSKAYGTSLSRSIKFKTSTENKEFGNFIKTVMTRCIHCTRCVRYNNEIIGNETFGVLNRGSKMEIGNYVPKALNSELSGNIIDICPVGALTIKPYSFKTRPWEVKVVETIDANDSFGDNIILNIKGSFVEKVTPKYVNNSIISDRSRFGYDFLNHNRLTKLLKKELNSFSFECTSWVHLISIFNSFALLKTKILFLVNEELEINSLLLIRFLINKYKNKFLLKSISSHEKQKSLNIYNSWYQNDIDKKSNLCVIFSSNLNAENILLNSKLRLKFLNENFKILNISGFSNSTFYIEFLNFNLQTALRLIETKIKKLSKMLIQHSNPLFYISENNLSRNLQSELFCYLKNLVPTATFLNTKQLCNSEGFSFLNISPLTKKDFIHAKKILIINLDENIRLYKLLKNFSIAKEIFWFVTHNSNLCFKTANFIIPIITYLEESQIFINSEQKAQKTIQAITGIENCKSLNNFLLSIYSLKAIKSKNKFFDFNLEIIDEQELFNSVLSSRRFSKEVSTLVLNKIKTYPIKFEKEDYYQFNKYTKNSITLAKHSLGLRKNVSNFFKVVSILNK
jgi:NADH-quinone oxidoreductase subunit G